MALIALLVFAAGVNPTTDDIAQAQRPSNACEFVSVGQERCGHMVARVRRLHCARTPDSNLRICRYQVAFHDPEGIGARYAEARRDVFARNAAGHWAFVEERDAPRQIAWFGRGLGDRANR